MRRCILGALISVLWPQIGFILLFRSGRQNDLILPSLECYPSFLCFFTHKANTRCTRILPAEVSNTVVIQLNESPRRTELFTYTQNPRLTWARPNLFCFLGLLFPMVIAPLVLGMKIIWIKLKLVPFKAKIHSVCLLDWLILRSMAFQIVLRVKDKWVFFFPLLI